MTNRTSIKKRIRARVFGTTERPRLTVFRSNKYLYAQIINDEEGKTYAAVAKMENAEEAGTKLAEAAMKAKIKKVVFDRNGYIYHGRIKVLADSARKKGLEF